MIEKMIILASTRINFEKMPLLCFYEQCYGWHILWTWVIAFWMTFGFRENEYHSRIGLTAANHIRLHGGSGIQTQFSKLIDPRRDLNP